MSEQGTVASNVPRVEEMPTSPNSGHPITIEVRVRLQALAIPEAAGGYSVIVPALPGCVTVADTIEEAQANVIEAAEGWLDVEYDRAKEKALREAAP